MVVSITTKNAFLVNQIIYNTIVFWFARNIFWCRVVVLASHWCARLVSSCYCTIFLKNIQVVRHKIEGKFKFTREINCCDIVIILILTSLNVVCHFFWATDEWVTLPELQMLTPEHSVRNKVASQHFSKTASDKMTVFFTYWYQGIPRGLSPWANYTDWAISACLRS
jgi:hypothetical protein